MEKTKTKYIIALFICILHLFCISCSTQSKYEKVSFGGKGSNQSFIDPKLKILLITPRVGYESISDETKLDYGQNEDNLEKYLESQAMLVFKSKGFQLKSKDELTGMPADYNEELMELTNNADQMFKGYLEEIFKQKIVSFGNKYDIPALLVINCKVKVGTGGSWNANSGAITSKNDRAIFKAAIIKTSDCSKLWSSNVQLRELPKIGDSNFIKAINSIFTNLIPKGE